MRLGIRRNHSHGLNRKRSLLGFNLKMPSREDCRFIEFYDMQSVTLIASFPSLEILTLCNGVSYDGKG